MPTQSPFNQPADSPWFRYFSQCAGAAVALVGLLMAVSWFAHWTAVLQFLPDATAMHFNTAVCFMLSGAALFLLPTPHQKIAPWLAGAVSVVTLLTLLEYLTGRDFHIDEIFLKAYLGKGSTYPVRMSALSAFCFVFTGLGILLAAMKKPWLQRLTATGIFACIATVTAFVALSGSSFGIGMARGGTYSSMPMSSAVEFLLLGGGLLCWSWQTSRRRNINFLRWLPLTGAVTLIAMVVFVNMVNTEELKRATFQHDHSVQVILTAEAYEDALIDLQHSVYRYVSAGDPGQLATFQDRQQQASQLFDRLVELTSDNPRQTAQLKSLSMAMSEVMAMDERRIAHHDHPNSGIADATEESRQKFDLTRDRLKTFRQTEQNLLEQRSAAEETDQHNAELLLVLGRVSVVLLLVLANIMAARELHRRKQIEHQLRETTTLQNAIFNSANYAVIALDPKGVVRTFNPAAERMLGYAAGEIIGQTTPMLWRDASEVAAEAKKLSHELGRTISPGIEVITGRTFHAQAEEYEATFIRKNGRRFPVSISLTALVDDQGALTGFLEVIADITERRRAEEKIRESEERFRAALDNAPIGMALVSPEGRWLKVNHALSAMLGYSDAELLATDFQHLTHPEDLAPDMALAQQVLAGSLTSYQFEKRYFHKLGHQVFALLHVSLVRDAKQQPLYFISQVENISDRKQREIEREKLIAELQQALVEVKTLSGMIPICGWCKNVRSDQGYWQTVEQYVRAHTDATFTHGVCPTCTEKFKADILKAAASTPA